MLKQIQNLFYTYTDITQADLEPADLAVSSLLYKTLTCFHQIYAAKLLSSQRSILLLHQFLFPVPALEDGL